MFGLTTQKAYNELHRVCIKLDARLEQAQDGWAEASGTNVYLETKLEAASILLRQARSLLKTMHPSHMKKSVQCDLADWNDAVKDVLGEREEGSSDVAVVEAVQET